MNDHFAGGTFLSTFGPGLAILIVGALIIRGVLNFLRGYSTPTERYLADLGRRRAGEIEVVNAEPVSIPRVPRGWMGSNYPPRPGTSGGCIGDDLPPSPDRYTAERCGEPLPPPGKGPYEWGRDHSGPWGSPGYFPESQDFSEQAVNEYWAERVIGQNVRREEDAEERKKRRERIDAETERLRLQNRQGLKDGLLDWSDPENWKGDK